MIDIRSESKEELKELICSDKNKSGCYSKESIWIKYFHHFYDELTTWVFPDDFSFTQNVYHYLNDDPELTLGLCPECGQRCSFVSINQGYLIYCSSICAQTSERVKTKIKTSFDSKSEEEKQNIKNKIRNTQISKPTEEKQLILEKRKQTCLERYNCTNPAQSEEYKQKFQNYEWVKSKNEKIYQTKKQNNSFHTSKIEDQLTKYFTDNNINFISQYMSELYPFSCDFYFPEKDLYTEIQGSWTHGPHPFSNSDEDLELLENWKSKNTTYYNNAVETWTVRDVKKREVAIQNNLNYLEIFSCDFNICLFEILKHI